MSISSCSGRDRTDPDFLSSTEVSVQIPQSPSITDPGSKEETYWREKCDRRILSHQIEVEELNHQLLFHAFLSSTLQGIRIRTLVVKNNQSHSESRWDLSGPPYQMKNYPSHRFIVVFPAHGTLLKNPVETFVRWCDLYSTLIDSNPYLSFPIHSR